MNGGRLTRGGKRITRGGKRITVAEGAAGECECCGDDEPDCSPCANIISATVRFSDVLYDCCVSLGGGEYGAFDQSVTINETDFLLNSFATVSGTCVDSLTIDFESHQVFNNSDCSGTPTDALQTNISLFYIFADEEWTLAIWRSGARPLFYSVVSALIEPGSCIPLVDSFTNSITACGQSVPGAGLSHGHGGTAAVTWDF